MMNQNKITCMSYNYSKISLSSKGRCGLEMCVWDSRWIWEPTPNFLKNRIHKRFYT